MKQLIPFTPTLLACATLALTSGYSASANAAQEAENVERIEGNRFAN